MENKEIENQATTYFDNNYEGPHSKDVEAERAKEEGMVQEDVQEKEREEAITAIEKRRLLSPNTRSLTLSLVFNQN